MYRRPLFLLVSFIVGLSVSSVWALAQESYDLRHREVTLRMIGHRILLLSGDSTSVVLPVEREDESYTLGFGSDFGFSPDELVETIESVLEESNITESYIVEMLACAQRKVVYSYEARDEEKTDIIPCRDRDLPISCYLLRVTFLLDADVLQESEAAASESERESRNPNLRYLLIGLAVVLVASVAYRLNRKGKPSEGKEWIAIGKFRFDAKRAALILERQKVELTGKESDLLLLLFQSVNTTVAREVIQNKIWGDEGDYVGRTLDVFISKLRKKLEADPAVKIVNVRGVGYKLVVE